MKSKLVLTAGCCLLSVASAQLPLAEKPSKPRKPRAQAYALEGLGALGGYAGCIVGGGCAVLVLAGPLFYAQDYYTLVPSGGLEVFGYGMLVVGVVAPASTGYAASRTGDRLGESGSPTWAIVGAYAGVPVAAGLAVLGTLASNNWGAAAAAVPLYALAGLAIPAGAVVGYNLGIPREASPGGFGGRLQPPGVALTGVKLPDHSVEYGVKVQLGGLRF